MIFDSDREKDARAIMDTADLVKEIATGHNTMFIKGIEQGRIQAYQEMLTLLNEKITQMQKGGE